MIMGFTQLVPPYIPTDDEEEEETNPCQPGRDTAASIDLSRYRTLLDRFGKFNKTPLQTHTNTETEEKETRTQNSNSSAEIQISNQFFRICTHVN